MKWWEKILEIDPDNQAARRYAEEIRAALARGASPDLSVTAEDTPDTFNTFQRQSSLAPDAARIEIGLTSIQSLVKPEGPEYEDNVGVMTAVAERLEQQRDWIAALETWELVQDLEPEHPKAGERIAALTRRLAARVEQPWRRGLEAFREKRYSRALKEFGLVVRLDPRNGLAQNYLAKTQDILGGQLQAMYAEGLSLYRRGRNAEALQAFQRVLAVDPEYLRTRWYISTLRERIRATDRRASRLQRAEASLQRADVADALELLAPMMREGGTDARVRALFREATEKRAQALQLYHKSLDAFAQRRTESAVRLARRSLALDQSSQARTVLVEASIQEGVLAYRQERYQAALAAWERARPLAPEHAMLIKYLRRVRNKLRFYEDQFGRPYRDPR
mgnify:CR=1 FL=1